jgi:hypothetical protein
MEVRQALLWTALLLAGQTTDVITTAVDRARGTLESMPASARLLELGGLGLLWSTKLLLVAAAGTALLLTARWARRDSRRSRTTFRFCLVAVQAATVGLVWVSLTNVALLSSLLQ